MIKPNWDIFKTKFSENPQSNFEWLCYLLFCKEFKKDIGIFRYKNQSAIETNPVKTDNELIGFQAKFYDTTLSSRKNEILTTLKKSKRDYPNITKIIFYTNQEWSQYKGQKPQGLIEIEKRTNELDIKLEWRTASFFESPFVCIDNEVIVKHFFTYNKSIFDSIEEQRKHTENILSSIKTTFNFKGQEFSINRDEIIVKITNSKSQVVILSGVAGVGKTAVVKKYYERQKKIPFYIFKATEFNNLRNLNDFFRNFNFMEFIKAHDNEKEKIIVIDSAEKLLDIENKEPFKEFLHVFLENKCKVIFTTRDNFIDNLNTDLSEIYGIFPKNINIQNINNEELMKLAQKYNFNLLTEPKLFELIKNPFYLNEYLSHYKEDESLDYIRFKNILWNKIVSQSKPNIEQCFLQIAFERANSGHFFISPKCESSILIELINNGVLGYESPYGYFITHDIYEEWTLEKIIEREFLNKTSVEEFFEKIRDSLPIRRGFRNWLSEKLFLDDEGIKLFVEEAINSNISSYWKDEILVSVLLSKYSETFFEIFKTELLENDQTLLKRLTFLLRIACKEVDNEFLKNIGVKTWDLSSLVIYLTKPKGKGWESLIKFIFNNIESIGIENINFILPVIYDWNSKIKKGETTRFASIIALKYYQWIIEEDIYFYNNEIKEKLLQTILYGAFEIKEELKEIFEKILKNRWEYHRNLYYYLVKMILVPKAENGFVGLEVAKVLPEYVLKLADWYWIYIPKKEKMSYYSIANEQYFILEEEMNHYYYPSSAFQTPIYWLLQYSLKETIDFIIKFTNKSVNHYAQSNFDSSVKKVKLYFDDDTIKEQYISNCLWNMYRGTGSPVSPDLLQSIHMALEKFFLEVGKVTDSKILESWLVYLLKNSNSSSISAVVASIVLAYPDKTFNVAKILFKTKEFILHDKTRLVLDYKAKSLYSIGYDLNYQNKIYQDERIKTCDAEHRKWGLEELFLNYQIFRSEKIGEEEAEKRQKELWEILDYYYSQLLDKDKETEEDKTWRLFLARMDRRKIDITTEKTDKGIVIQLNPQLEPELKKYSEKSLIKNSVFTKYTSLKLWATYKIQNEEKYKQYEQYEKNPKQALKEAKALIKELETNKSSEFYLINHSILAEVCSVLIKYYINKLTKEEKEFCRDIILNFASLSLKRNYQYQILDGVESAISVLPMIFREFPKERELIKAILMLTLFDSHYIAMYGEFADFPTRAIKELYSISFENAQSLMLGYLYLKPKYEALREKIHQESYAKGIYQIRELELLEAFIKEYEADLEKVVNNEITYEELGEIENLDLYILKRAFQLIPEDINNEIHKEIAKRFINAFVPKLLSDNKEDRINYKIKHDFLQKYAYFVLKLNQDEIDDYLQPFINSFNISETIADLFKEFIYAEDILNNYENFWKVWNLFKEKLFEICKEGESYGYIDEIIKSYLFATIFWREDAKEWHIFKNKNKIFFQEVSKKIGHCPSTLYALAKLLNGIGSSYINDGIYWISDIINNNLDLQEELEKNTIYYIENFIRKYIYKNYEKIKKTKDLKQRVLIILNFLVERGSVVGFMLRERII